MKNILIAVLGLLIIVGFVYYGSQKMPATPNKTAVSDYKNISYTIDGQKVLLTNGMSETEAAPGSASKTITTYFGNETIGDFNGDGMADRAFILTQTSGGSGTFYYVVAALTGIDSYVGTNAVLLGDRIAPQTTEFRDGKIIVNYAERKPEEPMTTPPSVGVSKYLTIENGALVETIR